MSGESVLSFVVDVAIVVVVVFDFDFLDFFFDSDEIRLSSSSSLMADFFEGAGIVVGSVMVLALVLLFFFDFDVFVLEIFVLEVLVLEDLVEGVGRGLFVDEINEVSLSFLVFLGIWISMVLLLIESSLLSIGKPFSFDLDVLIFSSWFLIFLVWYHHQIHL